MYGAITFLRVFGGLLLCGALLHPARLKAEGGGGPGLVTVKNSSDVVCYFTVLSDGRQRGFWEDYDGQGTYNEYEEIEPGNTGSMVAYVTPISGYKVEAHVESTLNDWNHYVYSETVPIQLTNNLEFYRATDGRYMFQPDSPGGGSGQFDWLSFTNLDSFAGAKNFPDFYNFNLTNAQNVVNGFFNNTNDLGGIHVGDAAAFINQFSNTVNAGTTTLPMDVVGTNMTAFMGFSPTYEATSTNWFVVTMEGLPILGHITRAFTWSFGPGVPELLTNTFWAVMWIIKATWVIFFEAMLFMFIKKELFEEIKGYYRTHPPNVQAASGGGFTYPGATRLMAASMIVATIAVAISWFSGWLLSKATDYDTLLTTLGYYRTSLESGVTPDANSDWIPRIIAWIILCFPLSIAMSTMGVYVLFEMTKEWIGNITLLALTYVNPAICILPFLLLLPMEAKGEVRVHLNNDGQSGRFYWQNVFHYFGTNFQNGETVAPFLTWVDVDGRSMVRYGESFPFTNGHCYIWTKATNNGAASFIVVNRKTTNSIWPEEMLYYAKPVTNQNTMNWAVAGVSGGIFLGFLSSIGYIFKRSLSASRWSGSD